MKRSPSKTHRPSRQRGFTLLVGLIMLVLLTLIAVATFRLGLTQATVVANSQYRNEGIGAAQQAIDVVINSSNFAVNPAAAIAQSNCSGGGANSLCVDTNGDGASDFKVTLTPQPRCVKAAVITTSSLDLSDPEDLACAAQSQQDFGLIKTGSSGNSLCANSTWEVTATAVDDATATNVTVAQGVSVRIAATAMDANCP
jgi:Tfp pilus assembly protein PilX